MSQINSATRPDRRATEIRHLDMPYTMPVYPTREAWVARAAALREQILVATGLWPAPEKTPLQAEVVGRLERDGYTIDKVRLQTLPGFYLCGNLFRPHRLTTLAPGILHPHGHTPLPVGRLAHAEAVGATLARLGCVTFAYDMIGYLDTDQLPHTFGGQREGLWGISLMGLQLWNSIRATDFLLSLPQIDPARIGCAGASGGGTQTFLLAAVDERIAVTVPAVMVSTTMQGGCLCENAPGLRLDTHNVEIAALTAPRPMLLIAATGDWTSRTPEVEYPAIREIYRLYDADERLACTIFDGPHGYERDSREAVYAWFARWFLGIDDLQQCREAVHPSRDGWHELLVHDGSTPLPARLDAGGLTRQMITAAQQRHAALQPQDASDLQRLRRTLGVTLQHALAATSPAPEEINAEVHNCEGAVTRLTLGRDSYGDALPAVLLMPAAAANGVGVLLVDERGIAAIVDSGSGALSPLASACLQHGCTVLSIDCFASGESPIPIADPHYKYPDTYNRTITANRVQDILTALAWLRGVHGVTRVAVVGAGQAGLWAMLAAGIAAPDALVADAAHFARQDDAAFLAYCAVPSLRNAGDFETACALAYPCRLFIHHTGDTFRLHWAPTLYQASNATQSIRLLSEQAQLDAILHWIMG